MHDGDANAFRVRGSVVCANDGSVISKLIRIFLLLLFDASVGHWKSCKSLCIKYIVNTLQFYMHRNVKRTTVISCPVLTVHAE